MTAHSIFGADTLVSKPLPFYYFLWHCASPMWLVDRTCHLLLLVMNLNNVQRTPFSFAKRKLQAIVYNVVDSTAALDMGKQCGSMCVGLTG